MSDHEYAEFYNLERRKAKKLHRCRECGGLIREGEIYNYHSGKWGGDFATFKTCYECEKLREDVNCGLKDDAACFGGLVDFVFESDELSHMQRLTAIMELRGVKPAEWMMERIQDGQAKKATA